MTVSSIIRHKVTPLVTADEHDVYLTLAERLTRHNIGVLVVLDLAGGLLGMVSERDLVRGLVKYNSAVFARTAGDLMARSVHTCSGENTEDDVMRMMVEKHVRHMPVVDEGRVIGLVSLGDVAQHRLTKLGHRMTDTIAAAPGSGSFSRYLGGRSRAAG